MFNESFKDFCERSGTTVGEWESSGLAWDTLKAIATHHEMQKGALLRAAEGIARDLQNIDPVHSVRFRVKDTDHLLAKIIRKRVEGSEKYANISVDNYQALITDLVGVRALHLFKEDLYRIDERIRDAWELEEVPPVAYVRGGDSKDRLEKAGFDVKNHNAGYRSVHYIVSTSPRRHKIFVEIQVRTIFEEGWAEIDHTVKYPNYSENEVIAEFLRIFNRLAGAADEMGSYVKGLAESVAQMDERIEAMRVEKDDALRNLELALTEAQKSKAQGAAHSDALAKAESELKKLTRSVSVPPKVSPSGQKGKPQVSNQDLLTLFSALGKWIGDANHAGEKNMLIDERFKITGPIRHSTGDFLSFTIVDGETKIPGRISGTALAILDRDKSTVDPVGVYQDHLGRIRQEAFKMRRVNPSLDVIVLGSNNFTSNAK
ncbi:GTP pyrophosphokinase [Cupriavidus taiwanensis]|uniref:GTP pyrophosphokinase n=1 Tax=Cupriavidus taiwanensis TaxID=164546 RepID=UPI0039C1A7BD